ncbi:phage tail protein [uncultured Clostridium sp.]|uniref:phage tail protein n=1 Tax=uncultured Clostridium sp. TaxID=59620 RepID=UPI0028E37C63|nr:phage tail protein [uncultured Clostridium sp.]
MSEKFYTILTKIGKSKIANFGINGEKVKFIKLKIGDGNGKYYNPTEEQKDLVNVVWEGDIGNIELDKDNPNWIVLETIIPPEIGDFTIREYGAFDDENNLLAIAKCPETYKPLISNGSIKELIIKMILSVSNTESISFEVDPNIMLAKKKEVDEVNKKVDDVTSQLKEIVNKVDNIKIADGTTTTKGIVKLNNAVNSTSQTEATTPSATKQAYDKGIEALNKANEAFQYANNGKTLIANVIGNIGASSTFAQLKDHVQLCKDNLRNNLVNKGVNATNTEGLSNLVDKVGNISITSMGGIQFSTGTFNLTNLGESFTVNFPFVPDMVVCMSSRADVYGVYTPTTFARGYYQVRYIGGSPRIILDIVPNGSKFTYAVATTGYATSFTYYALKF